METTGRVWDLGFRTLDMVRLKLAAATSLVVKHLPRCFLHLMVGLGNESDHEPFKLKADTETLSRLRQSRSSDIEFEC